MSATLLASRNRRREPLLHRKTQRVPNPQRVPAVVNGDTPTPFPDGVLLPPITTAPMPAIVAPSVGEPLLHRKTQRVPIPAGTKLILWAALCMGFSLMHALYKELAAESVAAINADPTFNQLSFADWAFLCTPARAGRCNSTITTRRTKKSCMFLHLGRESAGQPLLLTVPLSGGPWRASVERCLYDAKIPEALLGFLTQARWTLDGKK